MKIINILKGFFNYAFNRNKILAEKRMDICLACDKRDDELCSVCGCYLPAKTAVKSESCPVGKWNSKN